MSGLGLGLWLCSLAVGQIWAVSWANDLSWRAWGNRSLGRWPWSSWRRLWAAEDFCLKNRCYLSYHHEVMHLFEILWISLLLEKPMQYVLSLAVKPGWWCFNAEHLYQCMSWGAATLADPKALGTVGFRDPVDIGEKLTERLLKLKVSSCSEMSVDFWSDSTLALLVLVGLIGLRVNDCMTLDFLIECLAWGKGIGTGCRGQHVPNRHELTGSRKIWEAI